MVLAGTAQGPMNIQESCAAAEAAASKVAVLLGRGKVELEPYVAQVDPERCQGAGECVRVCPQEDAIHLETLHRERENVPAGGGHRGQLQRLRRVRQRLSQPGDRRAGLAVGRVRGDGGSDRGGDAGSGGCRMNMTE